MANTPSNETQAIQRAIAWCMSWTLENIHPMTREHLQIWAKTQGSEAIDEQTNEVQQILRSIRQLFELDHPKTLSTLQRITAENPLLWNPKIGLVYGGATKIKQYVFETNKLQEIRGASALLDRINLEDLKAFFDPSSPDPARSWLCQENAALADALIPQLVVYSTGGNILAFCPAPFVSDLANAIEKRYTQETLTANSCAVGATFKPLEMVFGLLPDTLSNDLFWFETYQQAYRDPAKRKFISAYIRPEEMPEGTGMPKPEQLWDAFCKRKSFNELTTYLAILFNQRRSGHDNSGRPSRRYPPMLETHPYFRRDGSEKRMATLQATTLPSQPWFSETTAIKYRVGQIAKRDGTNDSWYRQAQLQEINDVEVKSWVNKFEQYLQETDQYQMYRAGKAVTEARSLREIGNACRGYIAYIYADGNNMGGYIQNIQTPQEYKTFSRDVFAATEQSVYEAIATHLRPHQIKGLTDPDNENRNGAYIHPFEILTIGGDDVMLVVPADKALAIAKTLAEAFESHLQKIEAYRRTGTDNLTAVHRYQPTQAARSQCKLSLSAGVLITAEDTPIYYAQDLTEQLLKSAKEKGKQLKKEKVEYYGGTIDFLVLKTVTMISSNIQEFRREGLVKRQRTRDRNGNQYAQSLKLYAAPYTVHEIGGILECVKALKAANFPRSQLYQLRSFLDRGKRTAILNYLYFRVRLKQGQAALVHTFEQGWCAAETNGGNLAPWMYDAETSERESKRLSTKEKPIKASIYETILRDLVDLYDFVSEETVESATQSEEVRS